MLKVAHISFMPTILFGVEKKIKQMARCSLELGLNYTYFILNNSIEKNEFNLIYKKFAPLKIPLSLKKQQKLFTHLLIMKNIDLDEFDFVILRYPSSCSIGSCYFFSRYGDRLITEHHTNESIEYQEYRKGFINWIKFGLDDFCASIVLKKTRALIGVTKEIVDLELQKCGIKKQFFVLSNGIDLGSVPFTPSLIFDHKVLKLLFVASGESSWHGVDRLVESIYHYNNINGSIKIELHLVGGFNTNRYKNIDIVYYGFLEGSALDSVFRDVHIAISSLNLDRVGLKWASVLKSREYMARGVPFVYGYRDEDFRDENLALKVDSIRVEEILDYAKKVDTKKQKLMREFAKERLDWSVKLEGLNSFLQSIDKEIFFDDFVLDFAFNIFKSEEIKRDEAILELGCGDGKNLLKMIKCGFDVYGVDTMAKKLKNLKNHRVKLIDGVSLPFCSESFGAVFSYQVFEHIEHLESVANELFRVLKNRGVVYSEFAASYPIVDLHTTMPLVHLFKNRKLIYFIYRLFYRMGWFDSKKSFRKSYLYLKNHLHYRSYKEMDSIFTKVGFEVEDLTQKRREERLKSDGVGTIRELLRYKLFKTRGKSKSFGFFMLIYINLHTKIYRVTKNRVLLLRKR